MKLHVSLLLSPQLPSVMINTVEISPQNRQTSRKLPEGSLDRLRRRLQGDLDNIVLMALRKEPERRYQSVEQFSEDIRRHLEGLPVIARKDTFSYRASKFVQRNKVAVAALAFAILAIAYIGNCCRYHSMESESTSEISARIWSRSRTH